MRPPLMTAAPVLAVVLAAALVGGCSDGSDGDSAAESTPTATSTSPSDSGASTTTSATPEPVVRTRVTGEVATGLEAPWGIAFLPDGSALVSERDSDRVKLVTAAGEVSDVGSVRGVDGTGEGGLLGLALSPSYDEDQTVFAYFTAGDENVVARMTYDGNGLSDQRTVFDGIPSGPIHNGGRIAFGPDGFLYVGTGEAGQRDPSQDPDDLLGKILRITADGEAAPGNPTEGSPVWSLGHRNVQGLAWDERGRMWASEFGQNTWDELNRIVPGGNYGWPDVEGRSSDERFRNPVRQWHPDVASPSGIAVADGSVFMAALRGERLWQVPLEGAGTGEPTAVLEGEYGRLRAVVRAPDGALWVLTSNRDGRGDPAEDDDRILRLTV